MEDSGPHAALRDNSPEEEQCENIVAGATADRTQSCEEPTMKRAKLTVVDDNSSAPQTKPFPCYLLGCGKSCPTRNALTKHLARYHSDRVKERLASAHSAVTAVRISGVTLTQSTRTTTERKLPYRNSKCEQRNE